MRKLVLALAAAALTVPALPAHALGPRSQQVESSRGPDGRIHCKRSNGTMGLIAGGGAGVFAGRAIDKRGDRTTGTILGGALGALLGRQVQKSMSRCR